MAAFVGSASLPQSRASAASASSPQDGVQVDIPQGPLAGALRQFATATGTNLHYDAPLVQGVISSGLHGRYSARTGFSQLLAGHGLMAQESRPGYFIVSKTQAPAIITLGPVRVGGGGNGGVAGQGAAGGSNQIFREARAVSVITRTEMDRTPARHAADLLLNTPGVASSVSRLDPGLSINIRGMQDFGRVNMMIDGMRQDFVSNGHQQRNGEMYIDSELVSSVDIERGPRNDVHGMGAIGGEANFHTLDFDDIMKDGKNWGVRLRGTTGSNAVHFLGSAAAAGKIEKAGTNQSIEFLGAWSRHWIGGYDIGNWGGSGIASNAYRPAGSSATGPTPSALETINTIKYANQLQDSALAKARVNFGANNYLQFTYSGSWLNYRNTLDAQGNILDANGSPWLDLGTDHVGNNNFSLDYRFAPKGNRWADLNVKFYMAKTNMNTQTNPQYSPNHTTNALTTYNWRAGVCLRNPIPTVAAIPCQYGVASDQRINMRTFGIQADNTSRFPVWKGTMLIANYGGEFLEDHQTTTVDNYHAGQLLPQNSEWGEGAGFDPTGHRFMGSGFANFKLQNEIYTISAGVRYDHYWLNGDTQMPGSEDIYQSRFDKYEAWWCGTSTNAYHQNPSLFQANCRGAKNGGEAWVIQNTPNYYTGAGSGQYTPQWITQTTNYNYHVHRSQGRVLPNVGASVRPTKWLELYASWAMSWRPPSLDETLMAGGHPLAGVQLYPNPDLKPEETRSWEVGANLHFHDILTHGDVFFGKIGYFDTRATNYVYTKQGADLPGGVNGLDTYKLGNIMFVNDVAPIHFRGVEMETRYDAGVAYASVSATVYTSGNQDFCSRLYPLGGASGRYDQINENGTYPAPHQQAVSAGYPSYAAMLNSLTRCGDMPMNSSRNQWIDKMSATVGVRLLQRRLDTGFRVYYSGNGGYQYNSTNGAVGTGVYGHWNNYPKYVTLDWYGSYVVNRMVRLSASIQNMTDLRYIDGYGDIIARTWAPGRTVEGGVQVAF